MSLRDRIVALADDLEQPLVRAAVYTGEFTRGQHNGEDQERLHIAHLLRLILAQDATERGETLDDVMGDTP
jgi:hypothetical protein